MSRAEWGAVKPKAQNPLDAARVSAAYLHWIGGTPGVMFDAAAVMRQIQRDHMAGEYVDIAYSWAIDPRYGTLYEGRGWSIADGATRHMGGKSVSLLVMNGSANNPANADNAKPKFTAAGIEGVRRWLDEAHARYPNMIVVQGHREAPGNSTACPGNETVQLIHDGAFTVPHTPDLPPPGEDDEMPPAKIVSNKRGDLYLVQPSGTAVYLRTAADVEAARFFGAVDAKGDATALLRITGLLPPAS